MDMHRNPRLCREKSAPNLHRYFPDARLNAFRFHSGIVPLTLLAANWEIKPTSTMTPIYIPGDHEAVFFSHKQRGIRDETVTCLAAARLEENDGLPAAL